MLVKKNWPEANRCRVIDNRLNLCFEADAIFDTAIDLYDNFNYLYKELIHQLNVFDSLALFAFQSRLKVT